MIGYVIETLVTMEQINATKTQFREVIEKREQLEPATERLLLKYIREMNEEYWYYISAHETTQKAILQWKKFQRKNPTVKGRIAKAEFASINNASDYKILLHFPLLKTL